MQLTGSVMVQRSVWMALALALLASFFLAATALAAQPAAEAIGEVTFVQGVATAQAPGATPRFLQKGEPLYEGEVISTGGQGYALIAFKDGTKFTLRPNTSFAVERYRQTAGSESAAFRLLKGGLRAITGALSKRSPNALEISTTNATIGIRGTSFDARLCEAECAEEQARAPRKAPVVKTELIVARVALLTGSAQAIPAAGEARALSVGSALFNGDTIRTAKASHAVLAFRDQSKVTVIADSELKLEDVRFTGPKADGGNFAVRIVRGGVRALTGLLGRNNPKAVNYGITNAVIGLRGSGFDGYETEHCADGQACTPAAFLSTWLDGTELRAPDQPPLPVDQGQTGVYVPSSGLLSLLSATPEFIDPNAPRPDTVPVNFDTLFAAVQVDTPGAGLHLGMRGEGETILRGPGGSIDLAGNEAGWLPAGQDLPVRITPNWAGIMNSGLPAPESFDARTTRVLELLNPGDVICEIR